MTHQPGSRVLSLVGQDEAPFEEIFAVQDTAVIIKGVKIIDKLQPATNPSTGEFYLAKAVEIVKSDPMLAVLQLTTKKISQNNVILQDAVNTLLTEVDNLIGVALPEVTQEELHKTLTHIFIDLKSQENEQWFHIVSSSSSTTYHYNAAFVVQNELTGWLFYVLPWALTVTINVDQQALFALQLNDKVDYSIEIEALKIGAQISEPMNIRKGGASWRT
jgi:hypothetical protein